VDTALMNAEKNQNSEKEKIKKTHDFVGKSFESKVSTAKKIIIF